MALAIAISVKSNLGVSPVSTVPYAITCIWGIELGRATVLFHLGLVVLQLLLLRKAFPMKSLLQVPVGIVFGLFNSLCMYLVGLLPVVDPIWIRLCMSLFSSVAIAFGIFLYVPADIVPLAGEGAMLAVSKVTKIKFSTVKIMFDVSMVVISFITCMVLIKSPGSVQVGTIIAAFLVGLTLKGYVRLWGSARDRILAYGKVEEAPAIASPLLEIMKKDVYTVSEDASYLDVLRMFSEKHISGAPVVDASGELVGFISDGDILRFLSAEHPLFVHSNDLEQIDFNDRLNSLLDQHIGNLAAKRIISVNAYDDLAEVCYCLAQNHLKKAPVMKNGKMIGIINRSNILHYADRLLNV